MTGVYVIFNLWAGKSYVGSSVNIQGRWRKHLSDLRNGAHPNRYLQAAWNKYGESSFVFGALELVGKAGLVVAEQFWIDLLDSAKAGYNLRPLAQSNFGLKWTPARRAKMPDFSGARNPFFGRKHSEESRTKMSESCKYAPPHGMTGKRHTPEARLKMSVGHLNQSLEVREKRRISAKKAWARGAFANRKPKRKTMG